MRNRYHEFFWGPFDDEDAVVIALQALDKADPYWDYDPFCTIFGADPLPEDYVFGFKSVPKDMRERIEKRRAKDWSFLSNAIGHAPGEKGSANE